jgi:hypothetical protein
MPLHPGPLPPSNNHSEYLMRRPLERLDRQFEDGLCRRAKARLHIQPKCLIL